MFTSAAVMTALDAVSARVPVERWRAAGLGAWPLFRYELATTNNYLINQKPASSGTSPSRLSRAREVIAARAVAQGDRLHDDSLLGHRDVVFYSDGVSFARLGGEAFEKFCDPLIDRLRNNFGLTSLLLTPMRHPLFPRRRKSLLVQDQLDVALSLSKLAARLAPVDVALAGFDEASAVVSSQLPNAVLPTRERLFRNAFISRRLSLLCEAWLRVVKPKVVFVVAYYGNERAAMVLACKRLKIPCVDVQHGAVSDIHFAYARMGRLPAGGYELLPDWFWVWTDDDKTRIESWAAASNGAHRVVTGGNPFITYCTARRHEPNLSSLTATLDAALDGNASHVLYSANGYETEAGLKVLAEVIAKTSATHRWWLRMHPARLEAAGRFRTALAGVPEAVGLMTLASELPLPVLLTRMNVHVTEGSSTADEAALFGVPTVLYAEEGTTQFAPLLAQGVAVAVDGLENVPDGLRSAASLKPRAKSGGPELEHEALHRIFVGSS